MNKMIDGYNLVKNPGLRPEALKTVYWFLTGDSRAYLYSNIAARTKRDKDVLK